jgi:hypothetical protein
LVEAEIDHVMALPLAERRRRGQVQNPSSGEFLRSETVVHLLRLDLREGGDGGPYLQTLIKRCEANLRSAIHPSVPQAVQLRKEILQEFALLFVGEVQDGGDELDFFECKFNSAFRGIRTNIFNAHITRIGHEAPEPSGPGGENDEGGSGGVVVDVWRAPQAEDALFVQQVRALVMTFPPNERKAIALCRIRGLTQAEAGLKIGVTERTIRNLLARADAKLASIKERG